MNNEQIIELSKVISSKYENTAGMVVLKDNKVLYEKYFNNCDNTNHIHVASVTKSILSILIGIAIDKKLIKSVNEKIIDFYPDFPIPENETTIKQITIKNMITMTAPYKQKVDNYEEFFTSEDWVKYSLNLLGGDDKIGEFRYTPIIGPDILSGILTKVTNKSVLDFAKENLFSPLGIDVSQNITFNSKEDQLEFYNNNKISGWCSDPKGINTAAWGLTLTPMDMAKIGQLYLQEGKYNGRQIVSSAWVKESTSKQSNWNGLGYGYLWWIISENEFAAMGDGGNIIYVNKENNMVVSSTCFMMVNAKDRIELIKRYIEPIFS